MILLTSPINQSFYTEESIPLSLYIHMPWCIQKCPYCDFNSHKSPDILPENAYIQALLADLDIDLMQYPPRSLTSIFIGGGTPSLFSPDSFQTLLEGMQNRLPFDKAIEITLEANPGTVEQQRFQDYRQLGINRLSLGIQSFNPKQLKILQRIHDDMQAHRAIDAARHAGFDNINIDLMHGLPQQTLKAGLDDLQTAIDYAPEHLSWYQLTIEPNTVFYRQKPPLPSEETLSLLEDQGFALLESHGYARYEISAFSKANQQAKHNVNYWLFGDYLGIGAGAHGKLTTKEGIFRTRKYSQPKAYLQQNKPYLAELTKIDANQTRFEFMLNTTRLEQPIPYSLFQARTKLPFSILSKPLEEAHQRGLVILNETYWQVTPLGRRFTNDLQGLFL